MSKKDDPDVNESESHRFTQNNEMANSKETDTLDNYQTMSDRVIQQFRTDKLALFGAIVVILFILTAIFAPYLAPHGPEETFGILQPPNSQSMTDIDNDGMSESVYHLLGTDSLGHDILSRIIYGARVSLLVATATVAIAFSVGTTIGILAGYYGGWIDSVLMRYVDFQWAFPELILAVGIIAITGGVGVTNVVLAIGIAYIDDFARLIRGEVLSIREEEYITASKVIGMSNYRIMRKEILPNAVAPLIVQGTVLIPLAILAEASLSFLGLGVKPTTPTWGLLISDGRQYIIQAWWVSVMPGLAIMITALSFNLMGDGLRDSFDISRNEVEER